MISSKFSKTSKSSKTLCALLLLAATTIWVGAVATPARAAATCTTTQASVSANLTPGAQVALYAPGGAITLYDFDASQAIPCGATTTTADQVVINGTSKKEYVQLDLSSGLLQPGLTPESGDPEIEVTVKFKGGSDTFAFIGTAAPDTLTATASGFEWNTDGDEDVTVTGAENLIMDGLGQSDTIDLTSANYSNNDVSGSAGNDVLVGSANGDFLDGGVGEDQVSGGPGDDSLLSGPGNDVMDGGPGKQDEFVGIFVGQTQDFPVAGLVMNLTNSAATNDGWNSSDVVGSVELVVGTQFGDTIIGRSASDGLEGLGGNDNLQGKGGDDLLLGEAGNDALNGGPGMDQCDGGPGKHDTVTPMTCEQVLNVP